MRVALLLGVSTLAAGNVFGPFNGLQVRERGVSYAEPVMGMTPRDSGLFGLFARQSCPSGNFACPDGGCCKTGQTCCGTYCCNSNSVCCKDFPNTCVPVGGECCAEGKYCEAGYRCAVKNGVGVCSPVSGGGSGGGATSGLGTPTSTRGGLGGGLSSTSPRPTATGGTGGGGGGGSSGGGGGGGAGGQAFTYTVPWSYQSFYWGSSTTVLRNGVATAIPIPQSTLVVTNQIVTFTAANSADASRSLGVISAELRVSVPPEATTAVNNPPPEFSNLPGFSVGAGASGGGSGGNGGGGGGGGPTQTGSPGSPGPAIAGGSWGLAMLVVAAMSVGMGMIML